MELCSHVEFNFTGTIDIEDPVNVYDWNTSIAL